MKEQSSHVFMFVACVVSLFLVFRMTDIDTERTISFFTMTAVHDVNDEKNAAYTEPEQKPIKAKQPKAPARMVEKHRDWLVKTTQANSRIAEKIVRITQNYQHGDLLLAMLTVESDARPNLKYANNYGLCQVSTVHFDREEQKRVKKLGFRSIRDCGVNSASDLFDIGKNICAANAILERMIKESRGDYALALKKYNANPRHKENYSRRVMERYRQIRAIRQKNA